MIMMTKDIPWYGELYLLFKVFLSLVAGGVIGWEREKVGKEAGIRTFGFMCAGACSFSVLAEIFSPDAAARIIANIVVGVGFIGGGLIYRVSERGASAHGLTTASSLWVTATVGVMIGLELYFLAMGTIILTLTVLHIPSSKIWVHLSEKKKKNNLTEQ